MVRRFGFYLGLLLLLAGALALLRDLWLWLDSGQGGDQGFRLHALGNLWAAVDRDSLLLLQPAIERHLAVWLWEWIVFPLLQAPAVVVFAVPGLILARLCRPRRVRRFY
ncbi:MAG TPA: hypothetical protein VJL84_07180 [Kiloniellales bacterium]|nr:hypothetical protein [Kiloniellales bacterium]